MVTTYAIETRQLDDLVKVITETINPIPSVSIIYLPKVTCDGP